VTPAAASTTTRASTWTSATAATFNLPSDLEHTDPKLAPRRGNGGFRPTRALKPGSPAIDHGKDRKLVWTAFNSNGVYPFIYGTT